MNVRVFVVSFLVLFFTISVTAQTTEFTYQGNLRDGANPASGNYDFEFALYDAPVGGTSLTTPLARDAVVVSNGAFAVKLDFGNQFPGANRFLEIRVRLSGQPGITTLSPRQQLTSNPYAVKSLSADTALSSTTATNALQLGGVAANQYVLTLDERLSDARTPTAGSTSYIQNQNAGPQASTNFNISGVGSANIINAVTQFNISGSRILSAGGSNLFAGVNAGDANTLGDFNSFFGRFAGSANSTGNGNSFFGSTAGMSNTTGNGNSFFGRWAGLFNTEGIDNSFFGREAGRGNTTGGLNAFFGSAAGRSNSTGLSNSYFGYSAGTDATGSSNSFFGRSAGAGNTLESLNTFIGAYSSGAAGVNGSTAIGYRAQVTQSDSLVLGSINGINGATANTNVGIGTTAPTERLHVVGNGLFTGNLSVGGTLNATLSGNGSALTNLNASNITTGTLNASRLPVPLTLSGSNGTHIIRGDNDAIAGTGLYGNVTAGTGFSYGVSGNSSSINGTGVFGRATSATGYTYGVRGLNDSTSGLGVSGSATAATGSTYGGHFSSVSTNGTGVYGWATAATGDTVGGYFRNSSTSGIGVLGWATAASGTIYGGFFQSDSTSGRGVYGIASAGSGTIYGVYGLASTAAGGYAVYASGDMGASGTKPFRIDHPDDPENMYLIHYATESPEVMNFYSGKVTLDAAGEAVVELPQYFAKINKDPRYTLTAVGAPMPMLHVAKEIDEAALSAGAKAGPGEPAPLCTFSIAGGAPGAKVSWRIEAVRNDRWVRTRGAGVEVEKEGVEKGTYQHPELYGQPKEKGMNYDAAKERPEPVRRP